MAQLTSGIIYGLFFFFLVIGALLGLKRGLVKSTIRIISVIIACVAVIFLVDPISSAILTTDLSSTGLTIGEIPLTTINDTLLAYIGQLLGIGSILATSPTLLALISAIPKIVISLVLFILLFFIVKGILYIADIFINKIFVKKDSKKPLYRIWGAVVGGVQGIICFLFILIPIAGAMNLINDTMNVVNPTSTPETALVALAEESASPLSQENSTDNNIANKAATTLDSYNDIFIIKMFNSIGYDTLTDAVFDKLTKIEINSSNSTTIRKELTVIAKVFSNVDKIKNVDVAHFSTENQEVANQIIDDAFSSPIIGGVANELVAGVADAWADSDPSAFMGIAKPELDSNLLESFDALLLNLRTNSVEDTKNDLKVIVATLKVSADHDITSTINTGDANLIVSALGKEGAMEDIISTLSSGKATKQILPSFIEFGLSYGYSSIGLESTRTNITKTADEVNWQTEPEILGNFFEGVSSVYQSSKGEGPILNRLDLIGFAKVLESIRDSQLLEDASQEITIQFLSSNLVVGVDCDTFISYVENDTTYKNLDFTLMLTTLKTSANIANDIKDISSGSSDVTELDSNDVGNLISGLTKADDASKQVIKDLASPENLQKSGVDSATANAVNVLVDSVSDYDGETQPPSTDEEKEFATNAVQDLLVASKNAKSNDPEQQIFKTRESMEQFIDNMLSSPFVWEVTIDKGAELGFKSESKTNLTETEQGWLNSILEQKVLNHECTETQADALKLMFYPIV